MKESLVTQLTALADKNRLKIIQEICKRGIITCADAEEITGLSQPTTSHHIKILIDAGLVDGKKNGRHLDMSINKTHFESISKILKSLAA